MALECVTGIAQVAVPVTDIGRATRFYRDRLGLKLLMEAPNMAFFDCSGVRLYLDANPGVVEAGGNSLLYFRAADMDGCHAALQQAGVTIHQEPRVVASLPDRDVWLMWIRDSESNLLGLMEERRKQ